MLNVGDRMPEVLPEGQRFYIRVKTFKDTVADVVQRFVDGQDEAVFDVYNEKILRHPNCDARTVLRVLAFYSGDLGE